jgi:hypothetical protein
MVETISSGILTGRRIEPTKRPRREILRVEAGFWATPDIELATSTV